MQTKFSKSHAFIIPWPICETVIDHYGHVNNVAYVKQLETTAWAHSNHLGLSIEQYQTLDRGMAITEHHIQYRAAVNVGDTLHCATWITHCDRRLYLTRYFEFYSQYKQTVVLTAQTHFACIALSSGKPARMPEAFAQPYYAEMLRQANEQEC
ncbi:MAG: thioesterase family protein [Glaciecola sp.]|jgi:acyl-CoA thioester hydrolase